MKLIPNVPLHLQRETSSHSRHLAGERGSDGRLRVADQDVAENREVSSGGGLLLAKVALSR